MLENEDLRLYASIAKIWGRKRKWGKKEEARRKLLGVSASFTDFASTRIYRTRFAEKTMEFRLFSEMPLTAWTLRQLKILGMWVGVGRKGGWGARGHERVSPRVTYADHLRCHRKNSYFTFFLCILFIKTLTICLKTILKIVSVNFLN